ncbi:MAG: ribonuclease H-like domain-containing protein [Chitinophagaceae bacterium]
MITDLLILDIETVPMVQEFSQLTNNWQTLWQEKNSRYLEDESISLEQSWKKRGGILSEFGKIVCISTAYFYEDDKHELHLKIKSIYSHNEKELLQQFIELCNKMYKINKNFWFAGHNIREFDIPFICRRILINGLQLPEYLWLHDRKPWETKMLDTLSWWRFGDNKNYTSLHLIANCLNIATSKDDIDGSQVQHVYYAENNLERIVTYCQKDVAVVAKIILHFKGLPIIKDDNIVIVK